MYKSVIIVGGGWCGVGVAGALSFNKYDDYLMLEQFDCFGGFWKHNTYDSVRMHDLSRLYKTPAHILENFKDRFLTKVEVPQYLQQYATHYGISNHAIFGFKVTNISCDDQNWVIKGIDKNNLETIYVCKYLCIATSYCRVPLVPENLFRSMSDYQGVIMHSRDYKNPIQFSEIANKQILLIGGGHSASEIAVELAKAGHKVTIAHRGGQYFMRSQTWEQYLSNQTIEKSLQFWGISMNDLKFKELLDLHDEKFSKQLYQVDEWRTPTLPAASFIICHKKTFIDDQNFLNLIEERSISIKDAVKKVIPNGVIYENDESDEFGGIILCTGFKHGLDELLDDDKIYLSDHRYKHLPPEKYPLPVTDGRSVSRIKKNLYFPGFDYGINQRVDFALHSWHVGETILSDIFPEFDPELHPSKFKLEIDLSTIV